MIDLSLSRRFERGSSSSVFDIKTPSTRNSTLDHNRLSDDSLIVRCIPRGSKQFTLFTSYRRETLLDEYVHLISAKQISYDESTKPLCHQIIAVKGASTPGDLSKKQFATSNTRRRNREARVGRKIPSGWNNSVLRYFVRSFL